MRHSARINREAPVRPSNGTEALSGPNVPAVIPANSWVAERSDEHGTRSVLPLIGWQVIDGEVYPLPRSLGADWIVRPALEGDDRLIRTTAARMRPQPTNQQTDWNPWRHLYP
jgi:hypothetical protein